MNGIQIKQIDVHKIYITRECLTDNRITLWLLYQVRDDFAKAVM